MGPVDDRDHNRNNGILSRIADALENRLVLLFVAAILGTSGGIALNKTNSNIRADPFTGTRGAALEERVRALETGNALNRLHREESKQWKLRIRKLERFCDKCKFKLEQIENK